MHRKSFSHFPALENGGQDWIRTSEGVSQRIYSPPRLATSVPTHFVCAKRSGVRAENRGDVLLLLQRPQRKWKFRGNAGNLRP
jgi:hypothetical protein